MKHASADIQLMEVATSAVSAACTRGVDHVGLTIRDLDRAIGEVRDLLGGGLCYIEGPIVEIEPGWMKHKLGATDGLFTLRVAAVKLGDINLELFEYRSDGGLHRPAIAGGHECMTLLYQTTEPAVFVASLAGSCRVEMRNNQAYEVEFDSGLTLIVQYGNENCLMPAFGLGAPHFDWVVSELMARFGMSERACIETPFGGGRVLSAQAGTSIVVIRSPGLKGRPANSDVGGHHIAFHADDVDASLSVLSRVGYRPLGRPETIAEGPIAGDRWVYLTSATGFQLELINMPDGQLPYECTSSVHRKAIGSRR